MLLLTRGQCRPSVAKTPLKDPRMTGIENATWFASSTDLCGINSHASDILKKPTLVQLVKKSNLTIFVWDGQLQPKDIKSLRDMKVNGIIYDE